MSAPDAPTNPFSAPTLVSDRHLRFMEEALVEGRRALPACLPNPPVGCVLVLGDQIIARGHTQPPYQPHAEPHALSQVPPGTDLSRVTAYVTLEPCSFHNRTPSCARALVGAGVGMVVVAMTDPHPRNRGKGIEIIEEAGIPVIQGVLADEARADLGPHVWQPGEPASAKVGE